MSGCTSPAGPVIRVAEIGDVAGLSPLLDHLGYRVDAGTLTERFAAVSRRPDHRLLIAEAASGLVGFAHAFLRPAIEKPVEVVVQALVVDPACRGTGLGRRLMAGIEDWARGLDVGSVALYSRIDRSDAHAFYGRLGYRPAATAHLLRKTL